MTGNILGTMFNFSGIMGVAMQGVTARNAVISNNIANVDTPGFKRSVLVFEDQLAEAIENQRGGGRLNLNNITPVIRNEYDWLSYRIDENNVDIEFEMASLYQNGVRFNTMATGIMHHYRMLNSVINMVL